MQDDFLKESRVKKSVLKNSHDKLNNTTLGNTSPITKGWQWKPFFIYQAMALLILCSWLWSPTRIMWDLVDDQLFFLLNQPLADHHWWAWIWAVGSLRPMDIVVGLVMLAFLLRGNFIFPTRQVQRALFMFISVLFLLLVMRTLFSEIIKLLDWQRASPSLIFEDAVRLSELFPDWQYWQPKDSSSTSFPGDHASVMLLWALFLSFFARGWPLAMIWLFATVGMLPRLVAGAHWGSDDFVGGLFLVLIAIAWGCYTPYAHRCSEAMMRITAPLLRRAATLPLLNRLSFLKKPSAELPARG